MNITIHNRRSVQLWYDMYSYFICLQVHRIDSILENYLIHSDKYDRVFLFFIFLFFLFFGRGP